MDTEYKPNKGHWSDCKTNGYDSDDGIKYAEPSECDCGGYYNSTINLSENDEVKELWATYHNARLVLQRKRAELLPAGTHIVSQIDPEVSAIVIDGAVFPDEVMTLNGPTLRWRDLEIRTYDPRICDA